MSSRLTKKSLVSVPDFLVKTPYLELPRIRAQHTQTTNQNRHFWCCQPQQLRLIDQCSSADSRSVAAAVGAESIRRRFERLEGLNVRVLLRRVHAPRNEGDFHIEPGVLRGLLDRRIAAENDQVGKRDLLPARLLKR